MKKLKEICELKHDIIENLDCYIKENGGLRSPKVCIEEVGQYIDMIKDLAATEKDCLEAMYYDTVVEAMGGGEDRDGYDRWRYSSGRFAPTGRGHMTGYTPNLRQNVYADGMIPDFMMHDGYGRMGYPSDSRSGDRSRSQSGRDYDRGDSTGRSGYPNGYGSPYERYLDARRHYHESRDDNDRKVMNHHAQEYTDEAVGSFKSMWETADPETKRKMKGSLSQLVAEMAV